MKTARRDTAASARPELTLAELTQLRSMLEQQQGFRLVQLAALARPGRPDLLGSAHDEVTASLVTGARAALRDVRDALARMDEGTYGRCTRCAASLGRERLEILPQTAMCMPCQRGTQRAVRSVVGRGTDHAGSRTAGNGPAEG